MGTTPAPPRQRQQDTALSPCPAQRGPTEDMESWGLGEGLGSEHTDVPCVCCAGDRAPSSAWPGRDVSLSRAVLLRAWGGRGERALRSFCFANRKLPRGEKANSVSLGSAVSQHRLMCGEAGGRMGAPRRRQQRGRGRGQGSEVGPAGRPRQGRRLGALPGFLLPTRFTLPGLLPQFPPDPDTPRGRVNPGASKTGPTSVPHTSWNPANRDHLGVCALHPTGHRPLG